MLKPITIFALALTAAVALAQDTMDVDAKSSKPKELLSFLDKDAYTKLSAPDAYILTSFVSGLPGNVQTALVRGLVMNAEEAKQLKTSKQTEANSMAPMGDMMPPKMDSGFRQGHRGERSFDMIAMDPMGRLSYADTLVILQKGQDATDLGLIASLFTLHPFTQDFLMFPQNERAFDAINRYIKANAMSTQPTRLKYTSLAPHTYVSPVVPR